MRGFYGGFGYGPLGFVGPVMMVIFWVVVVAALVVVIRHYLKKGGTGGDGAVEALRVRFAKGEIGKEEFEEKKKLLS